MPYTRQHCFQQHEATVLLKCCLVYGGLYSFDLSGNMLPEIGTCSIFWQHVACFLQQATLHWEHCYSNTVAQCRVANYPAPPIITAEILVKAGMTSVSAMT